LLSLETKTFAISSVGEKCFDTIQDLNMINLFKLYVF